MIHVTIPFETKPDWVCVLEGAKDILSDHNRWIKGDLRRQVHVVYGTHNLKSFWAYSLPGAIKEAARRSSYLERRVLLAETGALFSLVQVLDLRWHTDVQRWNDKAFRSHWDIKRALENALQVRYQA